MVITWGSEPNSRLEEVARTVIETPFTRRTWSELLFMMASMPIAFIGLAFVGITMVAGVVLAITFVGLVLIGVAVRGARGIGGLQRRLAGALLDEVIEEPDAILAATGLPGVAAVRPPGPDGVEGHGLPGRQGAPGHRGLLHRLQPLVGRTPVPHLSPLGAGQPRRAWRNGESSGSSSSPSYLSPGSGGPLSAWPR